MEWNLNTSTKGELILLSENISNIIIHGMELEYVDSILKMEL